MSSTRTQKLQEISTFVVNGRPTYKLDFLGTISIHGRDYFHVLRRYNNVYEFVFEDYHGELHFHKDYTVAQSIQRLLCLSDEQMHDLRVLSVYSMKHNGAPAISDSFLEMRWSAIQGNWHGLMMNLGGILEYKEEEETLVAHDAIDEDNSETDDVHARLNRQDEAIDYCLRALDDCRQDLDEIRSEIQTPNPKNTVHYPDAPEKALKCISYRTLNGGNGVKRQRLTDRFAELEKEEEMEEEEEYEEEEEEEEDQEEEEEMEEEDDDQEEEEEEEEEEDEDYLELRSGVKYYK